MEAKPELKELLNELAAMDAALAGAKRAYLEADSTYGERGVALESAVEKYLQNYTDPANQRAPEYQEAARECINRSNKFSKIRADLMSRMASLYVQLNLTAISTAVEAIKSLPTSSEPRTHGDPTELYRTFLK